MKEYEIKFVTSYGVLTSGYFYGTDPIEAKANAIKMGILPSSIRSVTFKENYRGYGHI